MGDITIKKALDDYKTVYMAYRNFADRTRVEYLNDLEDLVRFLEKSGINHVKKIGLPIIERYVAHLNKRDLPVYQGNGKLLQSAHFYHFYIRKVTHAVK